MLVSDVIAAIRAETLHDADTQVTDAQLIVHINLDYQNMYRRLPLAVAAALYGTQDSSQVIAAGSGNLTMPATYARLIRLEKQAGDAWLPVEISDELTPHYGVLNVREEGGILKLAPLSLTGGTYRIIFVPKPTALTSTANTVVLEPGLEDVLIQLGAAFVRRRHDEDPEPHLEMAKEVWKEQKSALIRRYGRHSQPGVRRVRCW